MVDEIIEKIQAKLAKIQNELDVLKDMTASLSAGLAEMVARNEIKLIEKEFEELIRKSGSISVGFSNLGEREVEELVASVQIKKAA